MLVFILLIMILVVAVDGSGCDSRGADGEYHLGAHCASNKQFQTLAFARPFTHLHSSSSSGKIPTTHPTKITKLILETADFSAISGWFSRSPHARRRSKAS